MIMIKGSIIFRGLLVNNFFLQTLIYEFTVTNKEPNNPHITPIITEAGKSPKSGVEVSAASFTSPDF